MILTVTVTAQLNSVAAPGAFEAMQRAAFGLAALGGGVLAYLVVGYTVGQLCSMFFRSGLLAGFFAILLSIGLVSWTGLMVGLGVPVIWSVAPIPLVLLAATWLRASHWMLERNGAKGWLSTASWLTGTACLLLAAVVAYRMTEIPAVFPGFAPEVAFQPSSAEAQATAAIYCRASELIVPMAKRQDTTEKETKEEYRARRKAWLDDNRKAIEMALAASRRPECDGLEPPGRERLGEAGANLAGILVQEAVSLASDGDLDAALERYLAVLRMSSHIRPRNRIPDSADMIERRAFTQLKSWAARPGQTPERIHTAIQAIEELMTRPPLRSDGIKAEYRIARQILKGDTDLLDAVRATSEARKQAVYSVKAMDWMPWERARSLRLVELVDGGRAKTDGSR